MGDESGEGRARGGLAKAPERPKLGEQHRGRRVPDPRNRRQEVALLAQVRVLIDMRADARAERLHLRLEESITC